MLRRDFRLRSAEVGDGRTLTLACVPFGVPAWVDDGAGPYRESFVRGAFQHVVAAANRVELRYDHRQAGPPYGFGLDLAEGDDGLSGRFRVAPGEHGDQIISLVEDGQLPGVSIGFVPGRSRESRDDDGPLVERLRVKRLGEVSLTPAATWEEARVLAVRAESDGSERAVAAVSARLRERERLALRRIRAGVR